MTKAKTNSRLLMILLWALTVTLLAALPLVTAQDDEPPPTPTPPELTEEPGIDITLIAPERPTPATSITAQGVTLDQFFDRVPQGRVGLLRVQGGEVAGARLRFLDQLVDFFAVENGDEDDGYYGLLVIDMDQTPRTYEFSVFAWLENGTRITIPAQVDVTLGGFVREDINVQPDRAYLTGPEIERAELARLDSIFETFTPEKLWDDEGFSPPINSAFTSPFGSFRVINQVVETRHTGWDLRAATGTPVGAAASGRVAYAGLMDIRGHHVIIDHGYGIFTGYSHLSQIHVTRGQTVRAGQIIGVSGNTGRSGGAHLHWEIAVNGKWVDTIDFLRMWLP
jgi:murein DD-endopeptidase MepM/ murein hydrolase activator NlpD